MDNGDNRGRFAFHDHDRRPRDSRFPPRRPPPPPPAPAARPKAVGMSQEDRKRSQRLFGGLLSTLGKAAKERGGGSGGMGGGSALSMLPPRRQERAGGQGERGSWNGSGSGNGYARRAEVDTRESAEESLSARRPADEERSQPRETQQTAEDLAELTRQRKIAQVQLDEQVMNTRHENVRMRAQNLQTVSEPRLYYRPWELSRQQEETIKEQERAAEETIAREKRDFAQERTERLAALEVEKDSKVDKKGEADKMQTGEDQPENGEAEATKDVDAEKVEGVVEAEKESEKEGEKEAGPQDSHEHPDEDHNQDHDHSDDHGNRHDHDERDMMVEEEDTVIY